MVTLEEQPVALTAEPAPRSRNWLGIVALVAGIVGASLVALVFGILGLRAARRGRATNRGLAVAGVVLSVTWLLLQSCVVVLTWASSGSAWSAGAEAGATELALAPAPGSDPALVRSAAQLVASRLVGEATVALHGSTVDVRFDAPPTEDQLAALTMPTSAQLRPVIEASESSISRGSVPPGSAVAPTWVGDPSYFVTASLANAYEFVDCSALTAWGVPPPSGVGLVACSADGLTKYLLGAAALSVADVARVTMDGPTVVLRFTDRGSTVLADLTGRLAQAAPPTNQLAFTADDRVSAAPVVASTVDGAWLLTFASVRDAEEFAGSLVFGSQLMTLQVVSSR